MNPFHLMFKYTEQSRQLLDLTNIIQNSRNPCLFNSIEEQLTDRLLAHAIKAPIPEIRLQHIPSCHLHNRTKIAERLLNAYHIALSHENASPLRRDGEDLWTGLLRNELPELMNIIDSKDAVALGNYLENFGASYVWFGGITTCIDGYNKSIKPEHVALTYLDKLICLAESLGILQLENPESGPYGSNMHSDLNEVIRRIEEEIGIDITPPLGIIHTDGIKAGKGIYHYRHINGLYSAIRVAQINTQKEAVCEFGGGIGITAMYCRRLGIHDYTIFDLPITCLLAGHYLLHALGEDAVTLYGETSRMDSIKIFPFWECQKIDSQKFSLAINQDSFPEIADNLIYEYLSQIERLSTKWFLSINHECFFPRTVNNFINKFNSYKKLYRSKCWVREGYVEELYSLNQ